MKLNDYVKEQDEHWEEVMKLAEKYGFIISAYGGTATLCCHKVYIEELGKEAYIDHMANMYSIKFDDVTMEER